MIHSLKKTGWLFFFFIFCLSPLKGSFAENDFFGARPTGLMELPDYHYPVFLYVPDNYSAEKDYTFIVSVPPPGEEAEKHIQFWTGIAKRRSMIVLVPTNLRPEDMPDKMDDWILKIKKDVSNRYRVKERGIFLMGIGEGAHYAAYLGIKHPEEFSAAGLMGAAWAGRYEKLIKLEPNFRRQIPFYVAFEKNTPDDQIDQAKKKALELEKKGYPIYLNMMSEGEQFSSNEFKNEMLKWLDEKSQGWGRDQVGKKKTWKERFGDWFDRNIKV